MQDARIRGALLAVCLACLLGSGIVLVKGRQSDPPIVIASPPPSAPQAASAADTPAALPKRPTRLYVDVAGAVRRPSVYLLPPNSRIMQAVLAAGGPADGADLDAVNLAEAVTDGEKVFVPKRGAAPEAVSAISPAETAAATTKPLLPPSLSLPGAHAKAVKKTGSRTDKISADSGEQIDLNLATLEQLERLPGVGPSMAARILAYRQQAGGFGKIEDLQLVTGIGPKKFAKIAPFVTL